MTTRLLIQRKITDRAELTIDKDTGESIYDFNEWFGVDFCGDFTESNRDEAVSIMKILKRDCWPLSSFRLLHYTVEVIAEI